MFRLFVMVLLLTGNINAAKGKSGGNQRKSKEECACPYTDNDCFDETGCFRYPDDFSLMKCSDVCDNLRDRGSGKDCKEYCPCYFDKLKIKECTANVTKIEKEKEGILEDLNDRNNELNNTKAELSKKINAIEYLERQLKELESKHKRLQASFKLWVPIGVLTTILVIALGFSCLRRWKGRKPIAASKTAFVTTPSPNETIKFQKNFLRQINNISDGSRTYVERFNFNNNHIPSDTSSNGSTISHNNSFNSMTNLPAAMVQGTSSSLPASRSGSGHCGANTNSFAHLYIEHTNATEINGKNGPRLNHFIPPPVARHLAQDQRNSTSRRSLTGEDGQRDNPYGIRTERNGDRFLTPLRRSSSTSRMAVIRRALMAEEHELETPIQPLTRQQQRPQTAGATEQSRKRAANDGLVMHELKLENLGEMEATTSPTIASTTTTGNKLSTFEEAADTVSDRTDPRM